jgi:hypothetical protein
MLITLCILIKKNNMESHTLNKSRTRRKTTAQHVVPFFQSSPIVLSALQHLAITGSSERHTSFLTSVMGHIVAVLPASNELFKQAVALCYSSGCLDGMESIILTGMNDAILSGNYHDVLLGKNLFKALGPKRRQSGRPVIFYDRKSSMITYLTLRAFMDVQKIVSATLIEKLMLHGLGAQVRDLTVTTVQPTFDMMKCKTWVDRTTTAASIITLVIAPEVAIGRRIVGWGSARLLTGILGLSRFQRLTGSFTLGRGVGWISGDLICIGLEFIDDKTSNHFDEIPKAGKNDLGLSPKDFIDPVDNENNIIPEPPEDENRPTGRVEEGDGFTVTALTPTATTMINDDGSSSTITNDENGNTIIVDQDADGNVTNVETVDDTVQPEATNNFPNPEGTDNGNPYSFSGYPVPDGNDNGGPLSKALLVGYPTPEGNDTGGPAGISVMSARGATFLLNIAPTFNSIGIGL